MKSMIFDLARIAKASAPLNIAYDRARAAIETLEDFLQRFDLPVSCGVAVKIDDDHDVLEGRCVKCRHWLGWARHGLEVSHACALQCPHFWSQHSLTGWFFGRYPPRVSALIQNFPKPEMSFARDQFATGVRRVCHPRILLKACEPMIVSHHVV